METLSVEDIKKVNESNETNSRNIDYLINRNFKNGYETGREEMKKTLSEQGQQIRVWLAKNIKHRGFGRGCETTINYAKLSDFLDSIYE
jgi:hypothetical protein